LVHPRIKRSKRSNDITTRGQLLRGVDYVVVSGGGSLVKSFGLKDPRESEASQTPAEPSRAEGRMREKVLAGKRSSAEG
jgi:hypothetical protein